MHPESQAPPPVAKGQVAKGVADFSHPLLGEGVTGPSETWASVLEKGSRDSDHCCLLMRRHSVHFCPRFGVSREDKGDVATLPTVGSREGMGEVAHSGYVPVLSTREPQKGKGYVAIRPPTCGSPRPQG